MRSGFTCVYPDVKEQTTAPFRVVFDEERGRLVSVDVGAEVDESLVMA